MYVCVCVCIRVQTERATATLVTSPAGRAVYGGGGSDVEVKYYSNYYLSNSERAANIQQVHTYDMYPPPQRCQYTTGIYRATTATHTHTHTHTHTTNTHTHTHTHTYVCIRIQSYYSSADTKAEREVEGPGARGERGYERGNEKGNEKGNGNMHESRERGKVANAEWNAGRCLHKNFKSTRYGRLM